MKKIRVFDPPMCCSTGVCGSNVDPALIEFAGTVNRIKKEGFDIERYNLSQEPMAFVNYSPAKQYLENCGQDKLPVIFIDDEMVFSKSYPLREEFLKVLGLKLKDEKTNKSSCCSGKKGCC